MRGARLTVLVYLLCAALAGAQGMPPLQMQQNGVANGTATTLNCKGNVSCVKRGSIYDVDAGAVATATPTRTATPTVTLTPTSTATRTPTPTATATGIVVGPQACAGSDKVASIDAAGNITCSSDLQGSGGATATAVTPTPTPVTLACPTAGDGSGGVRSVSDVNGFNVAVGCLPTSTSTAAVLTATPTPTVTPTAFVCGAGSVLDRAHPEACVLLPTPDGAGVTYATPTVVVSATPTAVVCATNAAYGLGGLFKANPDECQAVGPTPTPTATLTATPTVTASPAPTATPDAADEVARSTAAGVLGFTALPDVGATQKLQYSTTTHAFTAGTDDDVPEAGDFGALALTGDVTSSGLATTIAPDAVALGTDTTGNYAAGDGEAGGATKVTGSATLPATCTEKDVYQDTDSGGTELYVCTATNTWVKVIAGSDVPANETDPTVPLLSLADLGDLCAANEGTARNSADTANVCVNLAAPTPVVCRTATVYGVQVGGLYKANPEECAATPAPTATLGVTPTYTIPFATPTPVPSPTAPYPVGLQEGGVTVGNCNIVNLDGVGFDASGPTAGVCTITLATGVMFTTSTVQPSQLSRLAASDQTRYFGTSDQAGLKYDSTLDALAVIGRPLYAGVAPTASPTPTATAFATNSATATAVTPTIIVTPTPTVTATTGTPVATKTPALFAHGQPVRRATTYTLQVNANAGYYAPTGVWDSATGGFRETVRGPVPYRGHFEDLQCVVWKDADPGVRMTITIETGTAPTIGAASQITHTWAVALRADLINTRNPIQRDIDGVPFAAATVEKKTVWQWQAITVTGGGTWAGCTVQYVEDF